MKKEFEASDICAIIKACSEAKVASFHLKNLRIEFYDQIKREPTPNYHINLEEINKGNQPPTEEVQLQEDSISDDEMMIIDPVKYEEKLSGKS